MRLFEGLTLVALLISLLSFFLPGSKRPRWTAFLPSLAVLLVVIHLITEGHHWQMIPAYALAALLFLVTVRGILPGADMQKAAQSRRRRLLAVIGAILGLLALGTAAALSALSPVYRAQGPTEPGVGQTQTRAADGMVMVYVPAGEFKMGTAGLAWLRRPGSPRDRERAGFGGYAFPDERPQHTIYLDAFWIDQTEVTVTMFRAFVEATGYRTTAEQQGWGKPWTAGPMEAEWPHVDGADWQHPRGPDSSAQDDHPVAQVSWNDAAAYCAWAGGQLPTEAQWEKAARGIDGRMWPWGNTFDGNRVNGCDAQCQIERWKDERFDDGYAFTAPVGSFPDGASPYGALDMVGNLWEWVADWYAADYYADSPSANPAGPASGTVRAMRGGAWYDTDVWITSTVRHQNPAWDRYDDVGFRCASPAEGDFSIHLLTDDVAATELSTGNLAALKLDVQPILSVDDIVAYSPTTHEIELTAEAYERIGQLFTLPARVRGIPFVVSVGPDRIYAGAFWTPVSSISFDGVVICQPFDLDKRVISIRLGYPSPEAFTGKDPRSDPRILESLEAAGKLR